MVLLHAQPVVGSTTWSIDTESGVTNADSAACSQAEQRYTEYHLVVRIFPEELVNETSVGERLIDWPQVAQTVRLRSLP